MIAASNIIKYTRFGLHLLNADCLENRAQLIEGMVCKDQKLLSKAVNDFFSERVSTSLLDLFTSNREFRELRIKYLRKERPRAAINFEAGETEMQQDILEHFKFGVSLYEQLNEFQNTSKYSLTENMTASAF